MTRTQSQLVIDSKPQELLKHGAAINYRVESFKGILNDVKTAEAPEAFFLL